MPHRTRGNAGPQRFVWFDFETSGSDPRRDRPLQFAAQTTDAALQPIGDPIEIECAPSADTVFDPFATLITGLDPRRLERDGLSEPEFAAAIAAAFGIPGTCAAGYNSMRFDDEVVRFLFWRNFLDPYRREYADDRSRWDLIDLARMTYALRPEGIEWPQREDGAPSFRLSDLARANGLAHERAHNALSDVHATLALARLIRQRQPRLFDWHLAARDRARNHGLVDIRNGTPLIHVSSRYPAERGCLAMVYPLALLPDRPHALVVFDLQASPDELIDLDADALRDRVFTPRADLPEGVERVPLKIVHLNRCPALAPLRVLDGVDCERIGLDREHCMEHARCIAAAGSLGQKAAAVMRTQSGTSAAGDADTALYDGFVSPRDRRLCEQVAALPAAALAVSSLEFSDPRLNTLLTRYRARNFVHSLDADADDDWTRDVAARLWRGEEGRDLRDYAARVASARSTLAAGDPGHALLDVLLDRAGEQSRRFPESVLDA